MPELPEVETIVRDIAPSISARQITGVEVNWAGSLAGLTAQEFARALVGRVIRQVTRRAKYIILDLSDNNKLAIHLAMTGRLLLRSSNAPEDRFTRVTIALDNGQEIRFADARKFGRLRVLSPDEYIEFDRALGPEPLSRGFDLDRFREALRGKNARIKTLLLDQRFVAGIGNIYADEALFAAGINPNRSASGLSEREIEQLYHAIRQVLSSAIRDRGTTFDSYVDAFGRKGSHQLGLNVYRQEGKPCPRCGAPIKRQVIAGRGAHFCPTCQPLANGSASQSGRLSQKGR